VTQKKNYKLKLKTMMAKYSYVFVGVYLTVFILCMIGFYMAMQAGIKLESAGGQAGMLAGAWVACKVIQPFRILLSAALTPVVARFVGHKPTLENDIKPVVSSSD
jgi:hypothetical protein